MCLLCVFLKLRCVSLGGLAFGFFPVFGVARGVVLSWVGLRAMSIMVPRVEALLILAQVFLVLD